MKFYPRRLHLCRNSTNFGRWGIREDPDFESMKTGGKSCPSYGKGKCYVDDKPCKDIVYSRDNK